MRTPQVDEETTIVGDADTRSLARRSLASVHEFVDPRISPDERPSDAMLDEGYLHQLSDHSRHHDDRRHKEEKSEKKPEVSTSDGSVDETIYVSTSLFLLRTQLSLLNFAAPKIEFEEDDPRDPMNFSYGRKWAITVTASSFSLIAGTSRHSYGSNA